MIFKDINRIKNITNICVNPRLSAVNFLADDMAARKFATQIGVKFMGTIGILRIAIKQELISMDKGNSILQAMIDSGYFSPVRDLSELT